MGVRLRVGMVTAERDPPTCLTMAWLALVSTFRL